MKVFMYDLLENGLFVCDCFLFVVHVQIQLAQLLGHQHTYHDVHIHRSSMYGTFLPNPVDSNQDGNTVHGSPSEDARKVYTITEPPGTEMVPIHIRQDNRHRHAHLISSHINAC